MPDKTLPGASILVVEDNPVNQLLVRQQLQRLGHNATVVTTAAEGLAELTTDHEYDMVLMDWQLPDIDGLEATRRIRIAEAKSGRHVPVVAMTASAMPEDRIACRDAGMDAFMAKPVGLNDLDVMINKWATNQTKGPSEQLGSVDERPAHVITLSTLSRDLDDQTLVVGLVERFLTELDDRSEGLLTTAASGDLDTLRRIGHTLKSTSEMMGVLELRDVCRIAEKADEHTDIDHMATMFTETAAVARSTLVEWVSHQKAHQ